MRKYYKMMLASALITVGLASSHVQAEQEPLTMGLAMPLTGSQALYGTDQAKAAEWAIEDINEAGGVKGRPLKMILLDTQADPRQGISAVNRLINAEKVPVFGTAWSSVVKAVAPVSNRSKVLALSVGANSPDIAELGDYVYTTYPLADVDVRALAKHAFESMDAKKAAVLYIHNDSGVEGAQVYRNTFTELGGEIVAYEAYDAQSTDFTGALLKVKTTNPDIVHVQGLITDLPQVIGQMRQLGLQMPVTSYSAGYNPKLIEQLGSAAEGLIVSALSPSAEQNENVAAFIERWQTEEGRTPNGLPYTQYLYDLPYLVADLYAHLIETGQELNGENMRKALVEVKEFDLPMTGQLVVSPDHRVNKPVYLYEVQDGEFIHIATVE